MTYYYQNMSSVPTPAFSPCESFGKLISSANLQSYTIALLLGLSFSSIITNLSSGIILPAFSLLFKKNIGDGYVVLRKGDHPELYTSPDDVLTDTSASVLYYGKFVNAIIIFLINLLVVFILFRSVCVVAKRFHKQDSTLEK